MADAYNPVAGTARRVIDVGGRPAVLVALIGPELVQDEKLWAYVTTVLDEEEAYVRGHPEVLDDPRQG